MSNFIEEMELVIDDAKDVKKEIEEFYYEYGEVYTNTIESDKLFQSITEYFLNEDEIKLVEKYNITDGDFDYDDLYSTLSIDLFDSRKFYIHYTEETGKKFRKKVLEIVENKKK